jgi:aryl-alcohol dehydrogenase-like predicted oxidoreductase
MAGEFLHTTLGRTALPVFRLGLSGSYWPGERALRAGVDAGMNYLFWYFWDRQMTRVLRDVLPRNRENYIVATGVANLGTWMLRRGLDGCLRRLNTDYLDVFHIFWVGAGRLSGRTIDALQRAKQQGRIRHIAISTHARPYAAELVRRGVLDVLMMRYNAAHRGAEQEIFPSLAVSRPGIVSYTATRWGRLLKRPKQWPERDRVPSAGDCYRFVLSNPHVDLCLTAPRNARQLEANLEAVRRGPLDEEEMGFMRRFGDLVHAEARYFM